MYRIIDGRGTGKTSRLLLLAKENNGIVVCAWPHAMREKAYNYGLTGIDFMSYEEFIQNIKEQEVSVPFYRSDGTIENENRTIKGVFVDKAIFVDDLERLFNKMCFSKLTGYTISSED